MKGKPTDQRLQELASKWLNKTITADEKKEFARWYNSDQDHDVKIPPEFAENEEILEDRILFKIESVIKNNNNRTSPKIWLSVAASLLLLAGVSTYYFTHNRYVKPNEIAHQNTTNDDIKPGGNKAILTLANGSKINLSDVKNGVLTNQGKTLLKKDQEGQITYQASAKAEDQSLIYNTITVPKGGQFQIALSDSTKVWLNSASSVTFPVAFSKTERKITITGEVYLEVAKNKHLPFRVAAGKQVIEVLGTHFNINAYTDEPSIKTTLIEGSVKVTANDKTVILKPNQQADVLNNNTGDIKVSAADIENVLAWKNGAFQFDNTEMPAIMREISRWYDVQIKYEGQSPQRNFTGSISRNVNLSELLNMLKYTGVDFKTEGHTITVIN
ncbi:MAG: hypothetical protein JWR50_1182 [Mucilaginibacter sp.]|nr:hypothetical protein [Mucilaginibacter sp.]